MSQKLNKLEEGSEIMLDFTKLERFFQQQNIRGKKVIPVVIQDAVSKEILIGAYTNKEAYEYSVAKKMVALWSTSRNKLWIKGETSGNYLELKEIRFNCEQNFLLYVVRPKNSGACHTKDENGNFRKSCYYRKLSIDGKNLEKIN